MSRHPIGSLCLSLGPVLLPAALSRPAAAQAGTGAAMALQGRPRGTPRTPRTGRKPAARAVPRGGDSVLAFFKPGELKAWKASPATYDVTAILQRAIDKGRGRLFLPAGCYLINDAGALSVATGGLRLKGNLTLQGEGDRTILKQGSTTCYVASANRYDAGTRDPAENLRNLTIRGLQFQGPAVRAMPAAKGMQFVHLLNLNAVSEVLVEDCLFSGFQGDGIYLGSGNDGSSERHNQDVTIRTCRFDGIDRKNRNGISIIDGERILIEDCSFENCTAAGMPGCIDIEPDLALFQVVKDIRISRCRGSHCGGAGVQVMKKQPLAMSWGTIDISDCRFTDCVNGVFASILHADRADGGKGAERGGQGGAPVPMVRIRHNTFSNCVVPFQIIGGRHGEASDNQVTGGDPGAAKGDTPPPVPWASGTGAIEPGAGPWHHGRAARKETSMSEFDSQAWNWDADGAKVERARRVAGAILAEAGPLAGRTALEYGCGTGLLGFALQPHLAHVTLADTSEGMLTVLREKIAAGGVANMTPLELDLTTAPAPAARYDLVCTLMTLHHIPDTDAILARFFELLAPGGKLCVCDLDTEDGSFHGGRTDVHWGFDRQDLAGRMVRAGFRDIRFSTPYEIDRTSEGKPERYPLFLAVASR